ncbi:group III truncated hemoglobin [Martelella endophytica]|uniref:Preprotein translocase subunit TatC n=1 Tax=Martelella endophytica TaxID=1486262 RepID=A0A0D5LLP0_MAREN|nr:group III truncated hemoglobin [Martelella endophytica]AJY45071.1 preprotein translocase subunit TatC [Martelella endophytica]
MNGRSAPERTVIIDGKPLPEVLDEAMIAAVVHDFYDRIREDPLLGPVFNSRIAADDWPRHLGRMCDFWSATLLRTARYQGRPLPPHLAIPELERRHFERWLQLFAETVDTFCPEEVASLFLDRAMRIAHSFRLAIGFHRGEDTTGLCPIGYGDLVRPAGQVTNGEGA